MTALIFRALFLLASASIGFQIYKLRDQEELWGIVIGLAVAVVFIVLEILLTKRPIQSISAIVFGLITGMILAIIFFSIFRLVESDELVRRLNFGNKSDMALVVFLSLVLICCYMSVTIVYKTQDRFGFVIPYVEFQKEEKGARPIVIDTSVVIDGRLNDLCEANVFDTTLVIPKFVLQELQHVADSGDRLRRMRGRRGLEMLQRLQRDDRVAIQIHDGRSARGNTVDSKLVSLASQLQARVMTCDYNLAKFAELQNVETVNVNDLAMALRPTVLPGEELSLKIIRPGDEAGQGVGYLNDGTMVVVEQARDRIGQTGKVVVTSTLQTSAGRMIFGRIRSDSGGGSKDDSKRRPDRRS